MHEICTARHELVAHTLFIMQIPLSLQQMNQPVQEEVMIEKQSPIVMEMNSLASLLDSPCFFIQELNEYIKSFSPMAPQSRSRSCTTKEVIIQSQLCFALYDQLFTSPPPPVCVYTLHTYTFLFFITVHV